MEEEVDYSRERERARAWGGGVAMMQHIAPMSQESGAAVERPRYFFGKKKHKKNIKKKQYVAPMPQESGAGVREAWLESRKDISKAVKHVRERRCRRGVWRRR